MLEDETLVSLAVIIIRGSFRSWLAIFDNLESGDEHEVNESDCNCSIELILDLLDVFESNGLPNLISRSNFSSDVASARFTTI